MTVRAILDTKGHQILSVEPDARLAAAVKILGERKIGAVLVMSAGRLEGILSERDIVRVLGERGALLLGLCCGAVGFAIFGSAPTGPLFWLGIPVMSLWGISGAALQSLMTRLVAPDPQGQLQGATSSVQSVSQLVGPFLFTLTFSYFIGASAPWQLPGAPFLLAAVLMVVCGAIAVRATKTVL